MKNAINRVQVRGEDRSPREPGAKCGTQGNILTIQLDNSDNTQPDPSVGDGVISIEYTSKMN